MQKQSRLTTYILLGLGLGILTGYYAHDHLANPVGFADTMSLVTTLFLRLIKMIIAPLVFSTLVVGIARMGDASEVGRIGIKTLGWFFLASIMSLSLGLILVNLFRPGDAARPHGRQCRRQGRPGHLQPEPEGFRHPPGAVVDR
jgi:Na+/H+-dicarboxylate symporter